MPTGYTCKIEDGTITNGKDFIKLCLNDFGVMIHRRDEGMTMEPQNFEEVYATDVKYHDGEIENSLKKINEVVTEYTNDLEGFKSKLVCKLEQELNRLVINHREELDLQYKYQDIRNQVESWDCSDKYKEIKKFALNQIDISLPDINYYVEEIYKIKERIENIDTYAKEYFEGELEHNQWAIKYHTEQLDDIRKLIVERQTFYDGIIDEINKIKID